MLLALFARQLCGCVVVMGTLTIRCHDQDVICVELVVKWIVRQVRKAARCQLLAKGQLVLIMSLLVKL